MIFNHPLFNILIDQLTAATSFVCSFFKNCLCCGKSCLRNSERRTRNVIQADSVAEKEEAKAKNEYEKACKVFGFDEEERQAQLSRLQQGWQR